MVNKMRRLLSLLVFTTIVSIGVTLFKFWSWKYYYPVVQDLEPLEGVYILTMCRKSDLSNVRARLKSSPYKYLIVETNSQLEKPRSTIRGLNFLSKAASNFSTGPRNIVVIIADAYDVIFNGWKPSRFLDEFRSVGSNIVLSTEPTCWPIPYCDKGGLMKEYNNSLNDDQYANSGLIAGDLQSLRYMFDWINNTLAENMDDQEKIHRFYHKFKHSPRLQSMTLTWEPKKLVELDRNVSIFWSAMEDTIFKNNKSTHRMNKVLDTAISQQLCTAHSELKYGMPNIRCHPDLECGFKRVDCTGAWSSKPVNHFGSEICELSRIHPFPVNSGVIHFNGEGKHALQPFINKFKDCWQSDTRNLLRIL